MVGKVIFVGGYPGCGKSLITPIIGTFARVEMQKYNYQLEHICSLHHLGKIDEDAAVVMIKILTDLDLYNLMQTRDINFRPSDMSSIWKNPRTFRYIRRLFQPGDQAAMERIEKEKPILQILTHNLLIHGVPILKALGERLTILELVRHPLYMMRQWYLYIDRYGADARDFSIWFDYKGHSLPFFASGWEEQYLTSNSMDKVIYSLLHLSERSEEIMGELTEKQREQIIIIPFEPLVLNPWDYLKQLETSLGTKMTALTRKELKRQKVPRKMIADGRNMPIYRQYGWKPAGKGADEADELDQRRRFVAEHATPKAMEVLDRLCAAYEAEHWQSSSLAALATSRGAKFSLPQVAS